jgi:hypothetical protein
VAAVMQPLRGPSSWRLAVVGIAACVALCLPPAAAAHGTARVTALDYQARITRVGGAPDVRARIIDGDRKLEVTVARGHTVVVLGDMGEPFLRFSTDGVAVNRRAPTALINRLLRSGSAPALDPHAPPAWSAVSGGRRYTWHDHRLAPRQKAAVDGDVAWSIPLTVDGRPERVEGRLRHRTGPPLWPWLAVLAGAVVGAGVVVSRGGRRLLFGTTVAAAAVSSAAALLVRLALTLAPGAESTSGWVGFAVSWAVPVGAGVAVAYLRNAPYVSTAPGLAAMYAAFVGLGAAGVLVHGFVVSSWPAWLVRAGVVVAVSSGLVGAAAAIADVMRADPDRRRTTRPRRSGVAPRRTGSRVR